MQNLLLTARAMIEQHETDIDELWLAYFSIGGNAIKIEFEAFLYGIQEPSDIDVELLDIALEDIKEHSQSSRRPY